MPDKKPWNPENAVAAFTAALTRAGHDETFRSKLKDSWKSARDAVSEHGQIEIADDIRITFHEDELNGKYHVFYLPPLDPSQKEIPYEYATFFQGNYNAW